MTPLGKFLFYSRPDDTTMRNSLLTTLSQPPLVTRHTGGRAHLFSIFGTFGSSTTGRCKLALHALNVNFEGIIY